MNGLTPYPITPIGSFLGIILALLPLFSQIRKLSRAIWGYAIWIAVYNFINFVNTIIWHDNVNIVVPVWCDIATKLQVGAGVATHTCALVICVDLYKITRVRASIESTKDQRRKVMIYELFLILGLPFLVMALSVIIQPVRFDIIEEFGCDFTYYSYVAYIIYNGPQFTSSLGCAVLAPFTLRTFLRHRKEMNEFLSSSRVITHNKYNRLMVIACLDTIFILPGDITLLVINTTQGKDNLMNYPYISWKNVHDGVGGIAPGLSLSSISQSPASEWSGEDLFITKWNEWIYVLGAVVFFGVFGTTPEMRQHCRSAFWFIPERCGYNRKHTEVETASDVVFNSSPGLYIGIWPTANKRHGSLSFLETTIDACVTHSEGILVVESSDSGLTTTGTHCTASTETFVVGDKSQGAGGL